MAERLKSTHDQVVLIRMAEVCRRLKVSEWSIRRWIKSPDMRFPAPIRMGSLVGWRLADVERWVRDQEQRGNEDQRHDRAS
jgi:excisionase family DNA binding protein